MALSAEDNGDQTSERDAIPTHGQFMIEVGPPALSQSLNSGQLMDVCASVLLSHLSCNFFFFKNAFSC